MRHEKTVKMNLKLATQFMLRALKLRCPHCGEGTMFSNWITMRPACRTCGLRFDRGEHDHYIGAFLVNFIIAELLVVAGILAFIFAKWPNVPWDMMTWILIGSMVPAPFLTYPYSKSIWLALDLVFRPYEPMDFEERRA